MFLPFQDLRCLMWISVSPSPIAACISLLKSNGVEHVSQPPDLSHSSESLRLSGEQWDACFRNVLNKWRQSACVQCFGIGRYFEYLYFTTCFKVEFVFLYQNSAAYGIRCRSFCLVSKANNLPSKIVSR